MFRGDLPCDKQCLDCGLLRYSHKGKSAGISAVVGISKSILNRFTEMGFFQNAQKFVIHNTRSVPPAAPRRRRGKGETFKIGFLGTLSKIKGVEWLIDQFQSLSINASLLIAGKGKRDYEEKLRSLAKHPGITFLGYVRSADFYQMIDVLVVPSLWKEPLGMVAIEALANNLPVIANKSGGLEESVLNGVNGLFCTSSFPNSLGEAIIKLYQDVDLYHNFSRAARESVASVLSKERMLGEYKTVMDLFENNRSSIT
jgi:glycosyltransferase involved in cell wall biosynthesis